MPARVKRRDDAVLPKDDPLSYLTRPDGYDRVPVIVGTNRDENKLFMFGQPEHVRRILWLLPRLRDERQYNLSAEYLAKMWKANATAATSTASSRRGRRTSASSTPPPAGCSEDPFDTFPWPN